MIIIREKNQGKKKYYECIVCNNDGLEKTIQTIEYRLTKVEKDSQMYFVLYDDEMASISSFFMYVNFELFHLAYNTREQAV